MYWPTVLGCGLNLHAIRVPCTAFCWLLNVIPPVQALLAQPTLNRDAVHTGKSTDMRSWATLLMRSKPDERSWLFTYPSGYNHE